MTKRVPFTIGSDGQSERSAADAGRSIGISQASRIAAVAAERAVDSQTTAVALNGTPLGTQPRSHHGNPMAVGPTQAPAATQPDFRVPVTDPIVSVQVENVRNPLKINGALPKFSQPGVSAPPPPVAGQLSTQRGSIGCSQITLPDGSTRPT
jgi:hypothetical protein